jgi:hypothetical protein
MTATRHFFTVFLAFFGMFGLLQSIVTAKGITLKSHVVIEQQDTPTAQPDVQVLNVPTPPATANPTYNLIIYIMSSLSALVLTIMQYYNNRRRDRVEPHLRIDREKRTP